MKIAAIGGGVGGLYFSITMKLKRPDFEIEVFERNKPDDTFGWGVVLSDETLENMRQADPISAKHIHDHFAYWDDINVRKDGHSITSSGHGFCGIGRHLLLSLLQKRATDLGVKIHFETEIDNIETLMEDYDIVIASDGINSKVRHHFADAFMPNLDVRACKFTWLGTKQKFDDAFTFIFEETEHGRIWVHAYQFDDDTATFIIECHADTWAAWGFDEMSLDESLRTCEKIFAKHLGGHKLMSNANHLRGSAWLNFTRVNCDIWHYKNVVLLGDASATAHFSIGSGSKLALESAIALANYIHTEEKREDAFKLYQEERRLDVLRLQSAARNSTEWFEQIDRYWDMDIVQFNYALLTRSQRISHENLRLRDKAWLEQAENWFQKRAGVSEGARTPMFTPFKIREMQLQNRIIVSPMAQYKAVNGTPTDWHFSHYSERAKGGAGMVTVEMTCISPQGRITPGCPGLYAPEHELSWKRIIDFIHQETAAKVCCQIGHSGRKGSTQLGWEDMDAPLPDGNWDLLSASPIPWSENNATPKEMDEADMEKVLHQFVAATEMAARAGFDMIELHAAHGYLLSSFISPLSNQRTDAYGGTLENRLRYPLRVFAAMRAVWPVDKPMSVRLSAHDWCGDDGIQPDDAVEIARYFVKAGVDIVDVSAGQTSMQAAPVYGRMFQTPFSDRIRNDGHVPTMAVGNIYDADQVNSILMAGRADLVCIGRPHLADPYWTLHAGIDAKDTSCQWPQPYLAARDQAQRLAERIETTGIAI